VGSGCDLLLVTLRGSGNFYILKTFASCAIWKFGHINVASFPFMMVA